MSNLKHGMRRSAEYKAWSEAEQRCHNPNSEKFKWYGARGIAVCAEWMDDFAAFFAHIGVRPTGFELDRIDNSKGYQPGSVRWVTKRTNVQNRRNTVRVTYLGQDIRLDEYAALVGIPYGTAWARLKYRPHLISEAKNL